MTSSSLIFLILIACIPRVSPQLRRYANWVPTHVRYCEAVQRLTNPLIGGITCGRSSWNAMSLLFEPLNITSTVSLGLINVGWITSEALKNETGFWRTCKPYMVRLFDGLYKNSSAACALVVNPPRGLPNCTDNLTNFNYRSGSGYCMKSKVCGATSTIDFLKSADNSSLLWSWLPVTTSNLLASGFTKVGSCYGYAKQPNAGKNDANLIKYDTFY